MIKMGYVWYNTVKLFSIYSNTVKLVYYEI